MDRSYETLLTTSLRQQTHDKTKCHLKLKEQYTRFIGIKILFIVVFLILIAALTGSADIPAPDVYATIFNNFFHAHFNPNPIEAIDVGAIVAIEWGSRLPRILMGVAAGVGLAFAGSTQCRGYAGIHSQARIRLESHLLPVLAQRLEYCSMLTSPEAGIIRLENSRQGRSARSPQPSRSS